MKLGHSVFELQQDGDDGDDLLSVVPRKSGADISILAFGGNEVTFNLTPDEARDMAEALLRCADKADQ